MIKSVRFRITLWYGLTLLITLSIFSFLLYGSIKKVLNEHNDEFLQVSAEDMADTIESYIEFGKNTTSRENFPKNDPFFKMVSSIMNERISDPRMTVMPTRILDAKGDMLLDSRNVPDLSEISEETLKEVLKGNAVYDTLDSRSADGRENPYRSYATPVEKSGKTVYIVQVFRPLHQTQFALKTLSRYIFLLIPVTIILTGLLGTILASMALRPVHGIIKTIRQITVERLNLRITPPNTKDEIRELADIFNDMLSRLEESFFSQKRFIQDASHELKTPLTILKGELEVALKKARSSEEYASILRSNLEETERISRLVENLLTLAKFDNREIPPTLTLVNTDSLLKKTIENLEKMAGAKKVKISLSQAGNLPEIKADPSHIMRAFSNILDNAVKYSPPGGTVKVVSRKENRGISVSFSDEGPGITAENLPHIFNRFYRADSSRSTEGFGLGLAIAKSALGIYGASIGVKTEPGKGSVFTIHFPLQNI